MGKRREERAEKQKKKPKKERLIEVKWLTEEWEIWDKEKEAAKLEADAKKLVLEKFHKCYGTLWTGTIFIFFFFFFYFLTL